MTKQSSQQRSLHLLKLLIERYVQEGQPIGSKVLAAALEVSSATVRNIMADLERAGYLAAPHISAGRVPTELGYRFFVDHLMASQSIDDQVLQQYREQLDVGQNTNQLVQAASNLLSNFTRFAGVVSTPQLQTKKRLTQIEFLALSGKRVMAVIVFNNNEVENRIIKVEKDYSKFELEQASNFISAQCINKDVFSAREALLSALEKDRSALNKMMKDTLDLAQKVVEKDEQHDYVLAGESKLLEYADAMDLKKLRSLFDTFTEKQSMLQLLDKGLSADGVQIFIGKESGVDAFENWSMITAPYVKQGNVVGVLGVIGPARMDYDKTISTVDVTAKLLSAALDEG